MSCFEKLFLGVRRRKKKKRDRQQSNLTMVFIPHCQAQAVKNIKLPLWLIKGGLAIGVVGFLCAAYFTYGFFSLQYLLAENQVLQEVNWGQAGEIKELQKMTVTMQNKLEGLMQIDREVRDKVGLNEATEQPLLAWQPTHSFLELSEAQIRCPYCQKSFYKEGTVINLPGEAPEDVLADLRLEIAKVDFLLSSRARGLERLQLDIETQGAVPEAWPFRGYITSQFGWRDDPFKQEEKEKHSGLDIAGPYGSPIRAAGTGIVTFAGEKGNWGQMILLAHGFGYVSQYAHNSSLLVQEGEQVKQGQIIARMGDTGRCTGTHLHFGIAKNGEWIDPLEILK